MKSSLHFFTLFIAALTLLTTSSCTKKITPVQKKASPEKPLTTTEKILKNIYQNESGFFSNEANHGLKAVVSGH